MDYQQQLSKGKHSAIFAAVSVLKKKLFIAVPPGGHCRQLLGVYSDLVAGRSSWDLVANGAILTNILRADRQVIKLIYSSLTVEQNKLTCFWVVIILTGKAKSQSI